MVDELLAEDGELIDEAVTEEAGTDEAGTDEGMAAREDEVLAADELATAAAQFAAKFCWLVIALETLLRDIFTQPKLTNTSAAGKPSPQPPLGSILKRGPPVASPVVKFTQSS